MLIRLHKWRKKILIPLAALPLCMGTCDTSGAANLIVSGAIDIGAQVNVALFSTFIGAIQQTLLQSFPSADLLQILLGGNRMPFFG